MLPPESQMLEHDWRLCRLFLPDDRVEPRRPSANIPRRVGLAPIDRRRRQINVLHETGIDKVRGGDAAPDRGDAADAVIVVQPLEGGGQVVFKRDDGDPWTSGKCSRDFDPALIAGEQEHRHIGRGEDLRVEIEVAVDITICAGWRGSPKSCRSATSCGVWIVKNTECPTLDAPASTPSAATRDSPS